MNKGWKNLKGLVPSVNKIELQMKQKSFSDFVLLFVTSMEEPKISILIDANGLGNLLLKTYKSCFLRMTSTLYIQFDINMQLPKHTNSNVIVLCGK